MLPLILYSSVNSKGLGGLFRNLLYTSYYESQQHRQSSVSLIAVYRMIHIINFCLVLDTKTASTEELEFFVLLGNENYITYCVSFCFIARHLRTKYPRSCYTFSSDARKRLPLLPPSDGLRAVSSLNVKSCSGL